MTRGPATRRSARDLLAAWHRLSIPLPEQMPADSLFCHRPHLPVARGRGPDSRYHPPLWSELLPLERRFLPPYGFLAQVQHGPEPRGTLRYFGYRLPVERVAAPALRAFLPDCLRSEHSQALLHRSALSPGGMTQPLKPSRLRAQAYCVPHANALASTRIARILQPAGRQALPSGAPETRIGRPEGSRVLVLAV